MFFGGAKRAVGQGWMRCVALPFWDFSRVLLVGLRGSNHLSFVDGCCVGLVN